MEKYIITILFVLLSGFYACSTSDNHKPDEPKEPKDPLANVAFTIDSIYIREGAGKEGLIRYNFVDNHVRSWDDTEGEIKFTRDGDFIYRGSEVKGLPIYCIIGDYLCTYNVSGVLRAKYKKDGQYLRHSSLVFSQPISYYWGEVAFNRDGNFLRQGRERSGKVMFTISGDKYHQGEGTSGSVVFNRDGNYLRLGATKSGAIIFTIRDGLIYKGKDSEVVSFNIDNDFIRKGKLKVAIGER